MKLIVFTLLMTKSMFMSPELHAGFIHFSLCLRHCEVQTTEVTYPSMIFRFLTVHALHLLVRVVVPHHFKIIYSLVAKILSSTYCTCPYVHCRHICRWIYYFTILHFIFSVAVFFCLLKNSSQPSNLCRKTFFMRITY